MKQDLQLMDEAKHRQLLRDAEDALDKSDYETAVQNFEQAARMSGEFPGNLSLAWDLSHLHFINRLISSYPDNAPLNMQKAWILITMRWQQQAIKVCTTAIDQFTDNEAVRLVFQRTRLRAAIKLGGTPYQSEYLAEDFFATWNSMSGSTGKARWHFLQDFLSTKDVRAVPIFENLATSASLPDKVRDLFKHKAAQLNLLEQLTYDELT